MSKPTKAERDAARKVLQAYAKAAEKLADDTDQEKPTAWSDGIAVCIELLKGDPDETFKEYRDEYETGRE